MILIEMGVFLILNKSIEDDFLSGKICFILNLRVHQFVCYLLDYLKLIRYFLVTNTFAYERKNL